MKEEIAKLVAEGKNEEAFRLFEAEYDKPLDTEEAGRIYTELISAYMESENQLNREYATDLRDTEDALREIKNEEVAIKRQKVLEEISKDNLR